MVPSVSVMCTASRTTVTFSTCAYFVGSIAGEERAFQTAAASEGAGICADTDAEARIAKRVTSVALLSMVAPPHGWQESILPLSFRQAADWIHSGAQRTLGAALPKAAKWGGVR